MRYSQFSNLSTPNPKRISRSEARLALADEATIEPAAPLLHVVALRPRGGGGVGVDELFGIRGSS